MRKFEIINDKWIKTSSGKYPESQEQQLTMIRVSSIYKFVSYGNTDENFFNIRLEYDSSSFGYLELLYRKSDEEQFKQDVALLESLLTK